MRFSERKRGQVMVLASVTVLVLVLALLLSFNLTQAIHEKIRLQQHSDAMAFSMATIEARALNYFAYSNRAIAAAVVSEMSLHAYLSSMTLTAEMFKAANTSFLIIAAEECIVAAGCGPWCAECCKHIPHCTQAIQVASKFNQEKQKYEESIEGIERAFNDAVDGYSHFIDVINLGQKSVGDYTLQVLKGQHLERLHDQNAPCASQLAPKVGEMNASNFACALEGTVLTENCRDGSKESSPAARAKVMASVANAARGAFPKSRLSGFPSMMAPDTLQDLMTQIQSQGITVAMPMGGSARTLEGNSKSDCTSNSANQRGQSICGVEKQGVLTSMFYDFPGAATFDAEVFSNRDDGKHGPLGHQGQHSKWRGLVESDGADCFNDGDCFVNFRSGKDASEDFSQPSVYGFFRQDLRANLQCGRGPWELNGDGRLIIEDGDHGTGDLDLVPREVGTAVSRALVYFHRPDDWRMPPNLFDPYWKAKLHPLTRGRLVDVLSAGGVDLAEAEGPVEGVP